MQRGDLMKKNTQPTYDFKISFTAGFFGMLFLAGYCESQLFPALLACLVHETGHLFFMLFFERPPRAITFYAGGIALKKSPLINSVAKDFIILFAGALFNFISAILVYKITPNLAFANDFVGSSVVLGIFNLLPIGYFDGEKILSLLFENSKIYKFIKIIFLVIFLLAFAYILIYIKFSVSLFLVLLFIISSEIALFAQKTFV